MKYSYQWLKELSGTKKSPQQLAEMLMMHSFEVEGIEKSPHGLDGIVVGEVIRLKQHPNADKLRVAEVAVGKNDVRQIVCGAPNIAQGQKVVVAHPGTKLPNGIVIQVAELRGVESHGMVCSARELGLGDDHAGILVLPENTPVGVPFVQHFGLDDTVIEIKVLPDRGSDALAYRGIAREIAALDGHMPHFVAKQPAKNAKTVKKSSSERAPQITISDTEGCLRYIGVAFKNITIGESPLWLKAKLMLSGMRPVNNIVDITNYLMLFFGQPMHAFDADKISGTVVVRRALSGESLQILTGETKMLSSEDIVIADDMRVLALAGVMGGAYVAVTGQTTNIFLEIANFDGPTIRRMKTRHNLPTDASYRFERNLDPNLPGETMNEVISLITELSGGECVWMKDTYPRAAKPWNITLSLDRVKNVLGVEIPPSEAARYLTLLGLQTKKAAGQKKLDVTVPTRRPDLRDEWNLIEEIGRMRGYDGIAPMAPLVSLTPLVKNPEKNLERRTKEYLAHSGFDELMTYSFYGERDQAAARLPREQHLELENPMSPQQRLLRTTIIPAMLRKVRDNLRYFETFDCFEWGSVFAKGVGKQGVTEKKSLAFVSIQTKKGVRGNASATAGESFFILKGKMSAFLDAFHIEDVMFEPLSEVSGMPGVVMLHPTRSATIRSGKTILGVVGELHPSVARDYGLDSRVACAELDTSILAAVREREIIFKPLPKFPFAVRDISLTFPRTVTVDKVERLLREAGAPLLKQCELFDIYEQGEEKSLAFHLSFGADDRTLSSEEMDSAFDRIVALAKDRFEARLRDK
ncbi:MAG: phenylalanine--tRNA ligase subunit beta [Candidatus Moraniibacteriota bacterium]